MRRAPILQRLPPSGRIISASDEDRRVAVAALRLTRRIVAQKPLERFKPSEHIPGAEKVSDADLIRAAGDLGTTIFHPVGTAAMGPAHDRNAVLDERLRVRGVTRLARHRCFRDAKDHLGQHQLADDHDRREGRHDDARRRGSLTATRA